MIYTSDYELYHHGVKGQKWGVRRYQYADGTLTPAGKKRYYDTPELNRQKNELQSARSVYKTSKEAYNKAVNRYQNVPTSKNYDTMDKARTAYVVDRTAYRRAKLKYGTNKEVARIQEKGIEFKKKSKHRLKLEDQYKQLGMTDEQAQAAANKRIRTEKILAASAAVTVAACATYVAYKVRKNKIDGVIKAGESLQRIEMQDTGGKLHDVFYVSKGEHDNKRYKNLLGFARKSETGHAYIMEMTAKDDVKVASMDKCRKTFQELYKNDSAFRNDLKVDMPYNFDRLSKNKQYDLFNRKLAGTHGAESSKKFYNALKSAGYGALQDVNDMKYSGYAARNPLIVFDNSKNSIMVKSMTELTGNLHKKGTIELLKATGESAAKDMIQKVGPLSAAGLTTATVVTYRSDPNKLFSNQGGTSKWS